MMDNLIEVLPPLDGSACIHTDRRYFVLRKEGDRFLVSRRRFDPVHEFKIETVRTRWVPRSEWTEEDLNEKR